MWAQFLGAEGCGCLPRLGLLLIRVFNSPVGFDAMCGRRTIRPGRPASPACWSSVYVDDAACVEVDVHQLVPHGRRRVWAVIGIVGRSPMLRCGDPAV